MIYIVDMSSGLSLVVPVSILIDILVVSKAPLVIYIVDMSSGLSLVVPISIL